MLKKAVAAINQMVAVVTPTRNRLVNKQSIRFCAHCRNSMNANNNVCPHCQGLRNGYSG